MEITSCLILFEVIFCCEPRGICLIYSEKKLYKKQVIGEKWNTTSIKCIYTQ